ncbi:MAG TPA: hypothetical protein ENN17_07875 [bacterium]|nr:hypothetical protein [bacterium]
MKIPTISLLTGLALLPAASVRPGTQVITREMIQRSGIIRVSEIGTLLWAWHAVTLDGFRWAVYPLESPAPGGQNWILMVDHQRMDLDVLDRRCLYLLPLSLGIIDSVVVSTTPQIRDGLFVESGIIHIHTAPPRSGVTFRHRYAAGNETGDPGPWAFTPHATPNVDRVANDHFSSLSVGSERIWGRIGFGFNQFAATDQVLAGRLPDYPWEWLRAYVFSPFLHLGGKAFGGEHRLQIGYSRAGDSPWNSKQGSDLLFYGPLSREIPVRNVFRHAGLDGRLPVSSSLSLAYRCKQSAQSLESAAGFRDADPGRTVRNSHGTLELRAVRREWEGRVGFGRDRFDLRIKQGVTRTVSLARLYGDIAAAGPGRIRPGAAVHLTSDGDRVSVKALMHAAWRPGGRQRLETGWMYAERLPAEDDASRFREDRDGKIADPMPVRPDLDGDPGKYRHTGLFLEWMYDAPKTVIGVRGFVRRHRHMPADHDGAFRGTAALTAAPAAGTEDGTVAGGRIRLSYSPSRRLSFRFSYIRTLPFGGGPGFESAMNRSPRHKLSLAWDYRPAPSFGLHADFTCLSGTEWFPCGPADGYPGRLGNMVLLNLSVRKWMWGNRLRTGLMCFNVLNDPVRTHPLGARLDLSIFLNLELVFDFPR